MKSTIGISSWSLQQLSFTKGATIEDIICMVADSGAEGIDICEEYIPCHPQPDLVKIRELRHLVESKHLQMGATWFCTEPGRAMQASSEEHVLDIYKKNILIASEIGAKFVCIPMLLDLKNNTLEQEKEKFIHYYLRKNMICQCPMNVQGKKPMGSRWKLQNILTASIIPYARIWRHGDLIRRICH